MRVGAVGAWSYERRYTIEANGTAAAPSKPPTPALPFALQTTVLIDGPANI